MFYSCASQPGIPVRADFPAGAAARSWPPGVAVLALAARRLQRSGATDAANGTVINAVGAENEYANVLGQIGGRYVHVSAILDNPNTDPHTFEASPQRGPGGQRGAADRAERGGL